MGTATSRSAEFALDLNAARRHLSPTDQQELRRQRIRRVAEQRQQGGFPRSIASSEGVSLGQVQRDLQEAVDAGIVSGDTMPAVVQTSDGRYYPARRQEPVVDEPVEDETDEAPDGAEQPATPLRPQDVTAPVSARRIVVWDKGPAAQGSQRQLLPPPGRARLGHERPQRVA